MNRELLSRLLSQVAEGDLSPGDAVERLRALPFEPLRETNIDHHRLLRCGLEEVIFGGNKSTTAVCEAANALLSANGRVLLTRLSAEQMTAVLSCFPSAQRCEYSQTAWIRETSPCTRGSVAVVAAGSSDRAVAEEAARTLEFFGFQAHRFTDVGVAGLPRLLSALPGIELCEIAIAVAGMEGALPGVLAGLVALPVIGVPTSVGYGVAKDGMAALTGMLASCAPGLSVVNIDNGFGAAMCAAKFLTRFAETAPGLDGARPLG